MSCPVSAVGGAAPAGVRSEPSRVPTVDRHQGGAGGPQLLHKRDGCFDRFQQADLAEYRNLKPSRHRLHHITHQRPVLGVLHEIRAEVTRVGDALRTSQVDIHRVTGVLHEAPGGHHRGRIISAEVGHQRPVRGMGVPHRLPVGGVLHELAGVHHRTVAEVRPVPTAQHAERKLGPTNHRRQHVPVRRQRRGSCRHRRSTGAHTWGRCRNRYDVTLARRPLPLLHLLRTILLGIYLFLLSFPLVHDR
mmetsp:Transcript_17990/g.45565  ORF Transcript_17990/g.45565 Transcript_17990/m.45565 type:complete len:247 (-) Transcript_17990:927-1667(-)